MSSITYNVPNISCGHCVHTIQTELSELKGVQRVIASSDTKQVMVDFDAPATTAGIEARLAEINYPVAK